MNTVDNNEIQNQHKCFAEVVTFYLINSWGGYDPCVCCTGNTK